jgi:hypothetical protein
MCGQQPHAPVAPCDARGRERCAREATHQPLTARAREGHTLTSTTAERRVFPTIERDRAPRFVRATEQETARPARCESTGAQHAARDGRTHAATGEHITLAPRGLRALTLHTHMLQTTCERTVTRCTDTHLDLVLRERVGQFERVITLTGLGRRFRCLRPRERSEHGEGAREDDPSHVHGRPPPPCQANARRTVSPSTG